MPKKHILIVINSLSQGGAERVASILLERFLYDAQFDIELVLLEDEIAYEIPKGLKVHLLSKFNNHDSGLKKTLFIPVFAYKLRRIIKKSKPDIVMSFLYRADFVNVLASFLHDRPTIVSERVNASSTYDNPSLNAKINKFLIKTLYPKASHVINVSEGTKQDLVENFAIKADKQSVIYNPYDIEKIEKLSLERLDFENKKEESIVVVSRFRPIKNIEMALRAFALLERKAQLMLVGDGSEKENLLALVETLGIKERVRFVGGQDNPYKYMSKASIYLSSSSSEGFPNAMVEAMICGCAIISTDCPSGPREILAPDSDVAWQMREGVEYARYGTLVAVDDVKALAEALEKLLEDEAQRASYADRARERAKAFRIEHVYKAYSERLLSLMKKEEV